MSTVLAFALVISIGMLQTMAIAAKVEGSSFASSIFSILKLAAMVAIIVVLTGVVWWLAAILLIVIEFVIFLVLSLTVSALETL